MNKPYKKWIQKKPFMISCITTLIIFVLCSGKFSPSTKSSAFKRFSVRPSRAFSSVFSIKFQNTFSTEQQWTGTLELKKEGVNIGHQLFCLNQELLQKRPKFKFFNFCYKFLLGILFGEVNFFGETKRCSAKMLVCIVVSRKITEEFTFVNRTPV